LTRLPRTATVAALDRGLVFVALVDGPDDPHQLSCVSSLWPTSTVGRGEERWQPLPPPTDAAGKELRLASQSAVGVFNDQLAVLQMSAQAEGEMELAFWPVDGGPPNKAFRALPVSDAEDGSETRRPWSDLVAMLVLVAVFLVFWRRQESIAYPVALPAGMSIARLPRRVIAAAIDLLPAVVLVGYCWHDQIVQYAEQLYAARESKEQLAAIVMPRALFWAWLTFRLVYAGYCAVFELIFRATPGKRLMGCSVLSEALSRPTAGQIAIRNLTRLLELERYLLIWLLVLVIFLTRNRQRLGDLLARTIVVEGTLPPRDAEEDSSDLGSA